VIAARLRCSDPDVLQAVADALRDMLTQPGLAADATVVDAVVDAAQHHPNELVRGRAIASLWALPMERAEREVAVSALDAAAPPVRIWFALDGMAPDRSDPRRSAIVDRLVALSSHADPAVRGVAARRLGEMDDGDAARTRLVALLADEHPFVRCQAVEGLGYLRRSHQVLVGPVAALLDDSGPCRHSIDTPTIRGGTESVAIAFPAPVSLRAAQTLQSLSLESKERLSLGPVPTGDATALAKEIAAAKAWAQRHG
jgi:hypothetical protein